MTGRHATGLWNHEQPVLVAGWDTALCYSAGRNLWVVALENGAASPTDRPTTRSISEPSWSADGRYVYFSSYREGTDGAVANRRERRATRAV